MKVTRKQLFKKLIPFFEEEMGYTYFKDTISAASGLFAKKIDDSIFLSIGITTSNLFENSFTCDYFMAQSLRYACLFNGIEDAFLAPVQLLSEEELNKYRSKGVLSELNWWYSDDTYSIESFKESVRITEPRLLNNYELRERVAINEDTKHQHYLTTKVRMLVQSRVPVFETQFVPEKEKDGIPLIWFTAAEYVQKDEEYFNKNLIFSLAADAYRQYILDEIQAGKSQGQVLDSFHNK